METNKRTPEERRHDTHQLEEILSKLNEIQSYILRHEAKEAKQSAEAEPASTEQQVLLIKLDQLTLKRHAVLTATLGGVGYDDLATIMKCSQTTVKLHLKGALNTLDIPNRSSLLVTHKYLLDAIPDKLYLSRYGLSKRWWMEQKEDLMDVLTTVKPTNNQHQQEDGQP